MRTPPNMHRGPAPSTRSLLVVCLVALGLVPSSHGVDAPQPLSATGQTWALQSEFSDEFGGPSLDVGKWNNDISDWGLWSWEPGNVRVEDGLLKLRLQYAEHDAMRKGGSKKLFYTSGAIRSKAPPIRYGYFETRLKAAPLYPGASPAFWLFRSESNVWTEMDFELTQSTRVQLAGANCFVFRHRKFTTRRAPGDQRPFISEARDADTKADPRADFHVYGIEWEESQIRWYIDGRLVRTRKNDFWDQPLDLVVSLGLRHPYAAKPSPDGFPTEFEVDYVRVWKDRPTQQTVTGEGPQPDGGR